MPPSGIAQTALSSVAARVNRPKGGQSGVAALIAQQQDSQSQMDKLLRTIEKLQQENGGGWCSHCGRQSGGTRDREGCFPGSEDQGES